jgi:hypothetical protein
MNPDGIAAVLQMFNTEPSFPVFGIEYLEGEMDGECIISCAGKGTDGDIAIASSVEDNDIFDTQASNDVMRRLERQVEQ